MARTSTPRPQPERTGNSHYGVAVPREPTRTTNGIAAADGDWAQVVSVLPSVDSCGGAAQFSMHVAHLRGIAQYRLGRVAEAHQTWTAGKGRFSGDCPLDPLAELAAPLGSPAGEAQPAPLPPSPIREIRLAVAAASAARGRGDAAAAQAAIDVPAVWRARELHSLAWLADGWLRMTDCPHIDGGAAFRLRLALCRFLEAWDQQDGPERREVPWAEGKWKDDDLADLAGRAQAWLEERG